MEEKFEFQKNNKCMETICVMCPMGCSITITENEKILTVTGQSCKRGEIYGKAEYTSPIRMVTSLVKYKNKVVSVRTSQPILKAAIFEVLAEIKKIKIEKEVHCGDMLVKNIANSGADLIITGNL